jgi:hypothetical protein
MRPGTELSFFTCARFVTWGLPSDLSSHCITPAMHVMVDLSVPRMWEVDDGSAGRRLEAGGEEALEKNH